MSRLSNDQDVIKAARALLMDGGMAAASLPVSAPAALTAAALTITYTTDDPSITANGAVTIADGDAVTAAENLETAEELKDWINNLVTDITAARTALNSYITGANGRFGVAKPGVMSARSALTFTYTTDNPSITPNVAVTIADGDLTTAAEAHEYFVEAASQMALVAGEISRLNSEINTLIAEGIAEAAFLPARTSTNGGVAVTYTTDDPSITPGQSTTIADGDTVTSAELNDLIAEINDQIDKLGDDYAAMRTAYHAARTAAGQATS